jgi:metalloendopeptidase OMA1, mitochondrial
MIWYGFFLCCISACSQPNLFTICRFEFEADYIGLQLMAAAGYDPRVAPKVYEELGKLSGHNNDFMFTGFLGTHPSGRQRAKALTQPKIMEEALVLYNDARARSEVN